MTETAYFMTVCRDDLIDMTERLVQAIEAGFFQDTEKPLLVSMTGTFKSGKSLVVETARDIVCEECVAMLPSPFIQRWTGTSHHDKTPLEIAVLDGIAWENVDYPAFSRTRKAGGIDFVQNWPLMDEKADLAICVEGFIDYWAVANRRIADRAKHPEIFRALPQNYRQLQFNHFPAGQEMYRQVSSKLGAYRPADDFERFVSVRVNNKKLLNSRSFRDAFNAFCPQAGTLDKGPYGNESHSRADDFANALQPLQTPAPVNTDVLSVYRQDFPKVGLT